MRFTPSLYADLFDRYQPKVVVASTPGWRLDRYLLREASARGINTAAVVVGWDNPSSYSIPGARVNWITCWSEIQKHELVAGSDWLEERVNIGGIPSYDGYFRGEWLMPREEYFKMHNLDPGRKLLSYAASFVSFAPNYQNVEALARLVASDSLSQPCQLLVRLHPNHFMNVHLYAEERKKIHQLAQELPNVHVVEPVPLGGSLGYYSGEDMPEKASMMAYSDVFLTVYSTMVVEAAVHERPIISVCLDTPGGWNWPRKFSLPLSKIGDWPTHSRFRQAKAGKVAYNESELRGCGVLPAESRGGFGSP
jgi:CDP-glycerol glycerophosphotransferase (TagB/SpsB family)